MNSSIGARLSGRFYEFYVVQVRVVVAWRREFSEVNFPWLIITHKQKAIQCSVSGYLLNEG